MTNYDLLLEKIRTLGMDYKWASMFVKKLRDDENAFYVKDENAKKWALERGFYPGRIELYGLNDSNYLDYVPDYQYFMLHPMNNHFLTWLNKTTLKYVLNSNDVEDTMPDYYLYVENDLCGGRYTYLMDCPKDIKKDKDFIWNLLNKEKILALKPNSGTSGGLGFIKLELKENKIFENNKPIDRERFNVICDSLRNYIVTEYIHQNHELANIWSDSECTLRVIMCKMPTDARYEQASWTCAVSYARFGTSINGGASNMSSGGIGIGFNFETGEFRDFAVRYRRFTSDGKIMVYQHPDTHYKWQGKKLPNWDIVKDKINRICQHISSLDYLGFDVIISEKGMKLCEINSHPAIDYEQILCGPVLANKKVREFFEFKGLRKFKGVDFYKAYIECQE